MKFDIKSKIIRLDSKGMTLFEILVALGIFSLVIVFSVGLFISGIKTQKKVNELGLVNSEGSFLLERMIREIRMANAVSDMTITNSSGNVSANPGSRINFTNHEGKATVYCKANSAGVCSNSGSFISIGYGGTFMSASSSKIIVSDINFYLNGKTNNPQTDQPMITIVLELTSAKDSTVTTTMQTSVIPRVY